MSDGISFFGGKLGRNARRYVHRSVVAVSLAAFFFASSSRAQAPTPPAGPAPPPAPPPAQPRATPPAIARTGDAKEAEARFIRARQLFDEGDYALALVEFNRAYELSPNYRVQFNIAQIHIQQFNYAAARIALEKFLREGGAEIPEARKAQAEGDLQMLKGRTAYLKIVTVPPTAEVFVDDAPLGEGPFTTPVLVNAGQRKVTVTRAGFVPQTKAVTLAGGDKQELTIELAAVPVDDRPGGPKLTTVSKNNYTPAIIGWSATGVLGIGAVVFGGLYLSKQSDLREMQDPQARSVSEQLRSDAQASATRLAVAADVFGVLAIGAAAVSVYFTLRPPQTETLTTTSPTAKLRIMPTPTGVMGTF